MLEKTPRFPFPRGLDPDALLHSARLTLEPIQAAHASEMFGLWQDRDIYRFVPEEPPPALAWLAQRYDKLTSRQSPIGDEAWLQWALRRKQDQVLIGRVEASVRLDATAQLAWLLGTSYTGQGYAREAVRRMLDHLRDDYRHPRLAVPTPCGGAGLHARELGCRRRLFQSQDPSQELQNHSPVNWWVSSGLPPKVASSTV